MVYLLSEFFGIFGVDLQPPTTFSSFIPWLLFVFVGIAVVAYVFKLFGALTRMITGRRFM